MVPSISNLEAHTEKLVLPQSLMPPKPEPKTMGMLALFSLSLSLTTLGLWQKLSPLCEHNPNFPLAFVSVAILTLALGGIWWGAVARPEIALLEPTLCVTLFVGMAFFLGIGHLIPPVPGGEKPYSLVVVLAAMAPAYFLWGSGPGFFAALAFPKDRGSGRGLFSLVGLGLFSLALGILISALINHYVPIKDIWLTDIGALAAAGLLIWLWVSRKKTDEEVSFRFWPTRSLGYFTDESSYGQELLISAKSSSTLGLSSFLASICLGSIIYLVLSQGSFPKAYLPTDYGWLFFPLASISLGALLLGPALALFFSPMTALALNNWLTSLYVVLFLPLDQGSSSPIVLALPFILIGSFLPLAGRVGVSQKGFFALCLGKINFFLALGFVSGGIIGLILFSHIDALCGSLSYLALLAAFLAAAPHLSWLFTGFLTLVCALVYYFF
ncbi:MAG: hypothetical protein LBE38_09080 [Deltaproteobacteria bacterium]|jgi:hypothetical protein|nr:hypothetical protein [Deltaproteobacteria bacterium]